MKNNSCHFLFLILSFGLTAQNTNISGIVNTYTPVVQIDIPCNLITVQNSNGFNAGDKVLLIQMKGAVIDLSNTYAFGDIINLKNAGHYEFGNIASINGNKIILEKKLLRDYTASEAVQLIRVPQYVNATVTGLLTCPPWDGASGGVLVFEVSGALTLQADISANGKGYTGASWVNAITCTAPNYINCPPDNSAYYGVSPDTTAAKGESCVMLNPPYQNGRGKAATGGGGGNETNAGGGGGGNYASGGRGGNAYTSNAAVGGDGGAFISYSNAENRVFAGGAGGAGQVNDLHGTDGGDGGGIIILKASSVMGNSHKIMANGNDALAAGNDGAGGGGAGGSVLLDVGSFGSPLDIEVKGGKGGDNGHFLTHGTGGGGGGGIIWSSGALPNNVTLNVLGGVAGLATNNTSIYYNTTYGASAGSDGGSKEGLILPESTLPVPVLSDTLNVSLCGGQSYELPDGSIVNTPGSYPTHLTSFAGCDSLLITQVSFVDSFDIQLNAAICAGETYDFNGLILTSSGVYTDHLISAFGCDSIVTLHLDTQPPFSVDLGADQHIFIGATTQLHAVITRPDSLIQAINWIPPTPPYCDTCSTLEVNPLVSTQYIVAVTDVYGCEAYDTVSVEVDNERKVFIPNVFTPDNNGLNDHFSPYCGGGVSRVLEFRVFDRWGELVYEGMDFEPNDPQFSWDGTFRGKPLPSDVYAYYAFLLFEDGEKLLYQGDITLLR